MDDKQQVAGHPPAGCPDLNRKEIRGSHHVPVHYQESLPRGAFLPLWRWFYSMPCLFSIFFTVFGAMM
jgi:hypothetical protein